MRGSQTGITRNKIKFQRVAGVIQQSLSMKPLQIGLMAQDIEKVTPEAVGSTNGFKTVDYKIATDNAVRAA